MPIYVCRVDGQTFWSEADCHDHVDRHHPEWGHAVCVLGTPASARCAICNEPLTSKESFEQHMAATHSSTDDQKA